MSVGDRGNNRWCIPCGVFKNNTPGEIILDGIHWVEGVKEDVTVTPRSIRVDVKR
jgi:hypothetical protein